jgi:hypothetical protein
VEKVLFQLVQVQLILVVAVVVLQTLFQEQEQVVQELLLLGINTNS